MPGCSFLVRTRTVASDAPRSGISLPNSSFPSISPRPARLSCQFQPQQLPLAARSSCLNGVPRPLHPCIGSSARMRAHRRDSSTWRTPSPILAPRRLGIVRRCPRLWFPISCRGLANERRVFASQDRISSRPTNCSLRSLLCDPEHVSSLPQGCLHQPLRQGWSCTDEVFSNDQVSQVTVRHSLLCLLLRLW